MESSALHASDIPGDRFSAPARRRILVIDDEVDIRESLELLLSAEDYVVDLAENAATGLQKFEAGAYDLILLDLMMPDRSGLEVLADIRQRDRETPVFMMTAFGSVEVAVRALKGGANDYFPKPWDNEKLLIEIARMIDKGQLERENTQLKRAFKQRYSFPNIVGKSVSMVRLLDNVSAGCQQPDHHSGHRRNGNGQGTDRQSAFMPTRPAPTSRLCRSIAAPFLPTCSSRLSSDTSKGRLPAPWRIGRDLFEAANRGTIFFDEIGTISGELQVKLLRVMQDREFMPLGSNETVRVDVRVIAATNSDLRKLVDEGKFREDLYYRLNVINLALPPLRDRKEDLPLLVDHFFVKYCRENEKFLDADGRSTLSFEPEAMQILLEHNWPGNVRELENVVERAVVLATSNTVPAHVLPDYLQQAHGLKIRRDPSGTLTSDASLFETVADFETA